MRKKPVINKSEIVILSKTNEHLSRKMLIDCIQKATTNKRERSLEEKIMILKLLQLNEMNYKGTAELVGVHRMSLHNWWSEYGYVLEESEPEYLIAQTVENTLATVINNNYELINEAIAKLRDLVKRADNVRQIYPVVEVFRASAEVLKLNKEEPGANKGTFFSDLMKQMFKSDDNGNKG